MLGEGWLGAVGIGTGGLSGREYWSGVMSVALKGTQIQLYSGSLGCQRKNCSRMY